MIRYLPAILTAALVLAALVTLYRGVPRHLPYDNGPSYWTRLDEVRR